MRSSGQSSQPKRNQGRRKVNIEKIKNETNLQVTFSKRRVGLFKKASELCTLTGAEAGLVVFSPGNKAHSFGHPDIKMIADRFLALSPPHSNVDRSDHVQQSSIPGANRDIEYLAMLEKQLEVEKAKKEELDQIQMSVAIEKLNIQQLEALRGKIMSFSKNIKIRVKEAAKPPMVPFGDGMCAQPFVAQPSDDVIPYDQGASEANAPWSTQHYL
ncbi:agamous-like mads-box protein agl62 [Phtheirospermum japonicum]|uniref:Agamous-like mads-box protein agl62 n=1 Tax=Phtheirospermum japonicum TaxID=374723 RepID=A0A830B4B9_9LAMI|nr:agamous-like mads-box protein agl62 [Phtheirospermum japonicum]